MTNDRLNAFPERDALLKREGRVVAFHMKSWKHAFLRRFFPHKRFHFVEPFVTERSFRRRVLPLLTAGDEPQVFVWGRNLPGFAQAAIRRAGLDIFHVEDGFIRSLDPHAGYSPPYSLTFDRQRPYFDGTGSSDLEDLLGSYDFDNDPALIARARAGIEAIRRRRLTKYNGAAGESPLTGLADAAAPGERVLVIGQVEDDASIRYGCDRPFTNNDLVRLAASEHPGARILYKPHPDVLNGVRAGRSDPAEVADLCTVLTGRVSLPDALDHADCVYTITSLAGFEALMRGKSVTVVGAPFYAGWGLTDDRQPVARRSRKLSVEAVFAAAYLLYPLYFDASTGRASSFEAVLDLVAAGRERPVLPVADPVRWRPWGRYGLLGWRHLLTPIVARIVEKVGNRQDAELYRLNPAMFFRDLDEPKYRWIGKLLYPW